MRKYKHLYYPWNATIIIIAISYCEFTNNCICLVAAKNQSIYRPRKFIGSHNREMLESTLNIDSIHNHVYILIKQIDEIKLSFLLDFDILLYLINFFHKRLIYTSKDALRHYLNWITMCYKSIFSFFNIYKNYKGT